MPIRTMRHHSPSSSTTTTFSLKLGDGSCSRNTNSITTPNTTAISQSSNSNYPLTKLNSEANSSRPNIVTTTCDKSYNKSVDEEQVQVVENNNSSWSRTFGFHRKIVTQQKERHIGDKVMEECSLTNSKERLQQQSYFSSFHSGHKHNNNNMGGLKCSMFGSFVLIWICVTFGITPCLAQGHVTNVHAVAHKKAILPCDITPPIPMDMTILVLWYKDLGDMPLYSYDARSKPGAHAKNEAVLGQRAYFRTITDPASLSLENIQEQDAGMYRCRVDFMKSPTRNSKVNLTVIVPPQKPTIFDGSGNELGAIAGPYNEGSPMSLTCVASGGSPSPRVIWFRGGSLYDDSYFNLQAAVKNKMTVDRLTRADLHAVFSCQATNNNMSEPVTTTIQVEMYFRPLEVTLLGSNQLMSALQEIEIVCQSIGSRPSAQVSFYKDGIHLKSTREEVSPTGNITTAVLKLTPRVSDHGKNLICRSENPRLEGSALEDTWKLTVFFVPILSLSLGSNLDPENIRDGTDVFMDCKIHSNPWVYKVTWVHNGVIVQHNASAGIIMSNQSLVLQKVKRSSGGQYLCQATNIEGEGRSNPVELNVMYKPICRTEQKRVYGVAKGEQVEIECKVDSYPIADQFKWAFNNSAESIDVPQARFSTINSAKSATSSVLTYTPMTELDYGSVICFSSNIIGPQSDPCVFHIIPAGKPDPPFNCTVQNITSESLEIDCMEAFDGGLPQVFHSEIIDVGSLRLVHNLTSPIPFFIVNGLRPGQALKIFIYSANRKGISDKIVLEGQTIQEAEKRTASQASDFELTPILGVCVGIVCGLLVVLFGILLALRFRTDRPTPQLKATKTEYRVEVNDSEAEKNPDIIPSGKGENDYFVNTNSNNDRLFTNGPKRNGSITENFRNCTYYSDKSNSEITYAELCLDNNTNSSTGPTGGWSTSTVDRKRRRSPMDETPNNIIHANPGNTVIYATIDHCRSRNGEPPIHSVHHLHHQNQYHTPTSNVVSGGGVMISPQQQREIVSVRTPLLVSSQQESCV